MPQENFYTTSITTHINGNWISNSFVENYRRVYERQQWILIIIIDVIFSIKKQSPDDWPSSCDGDRTFRECPTCRVEWLSQWNRDPSFQLCPPFVCTPPAGCPSCLFRHASGWYRRRPFAPACSLPSQKFPSQTESGKCEMWGNKKRVGTAHGTDRLSSMQCSHTWTNWIAARWVARHYQIQERNIYIPFYRVTTNLLPSNSWYMRKLLRVTTITISDRFRLICDTDICFKFST